MNNNDFVKSFVSHWYNDAYYFGRVNVTRCFLFPSEAISSGYSLTDVPVLDSNEEKVPGWFLAQKGREFAFVRRA